MSLLRCRQRGGLALQSEDDLCVGLLDGAFTKSLHVVFAREMLGDEFVEMLHGVLAPRMRLMESTADLKTFSEVRTKICSSSEVEPSASRAFAPRQTQRPLAFSDC